MHVRAHNGSPDRTGRPGGISASARGMRRVVGEGGRSDSRQTDRRAGGVAAADAPPGARLQRHSSGTPATLQHAPAAPPVASHRGARSRGGPAAEAGRTGGRSLTPTRTRPPGRRRKHDLVVAAPLLCSGSVLVGMPPPGARPPPPPPLLALALAVVLAAAVPRPSEARLVQDPAPGAGYPELPGPGGYPDGYPEPVDFEDPPPAPGPPGPAASRAAAAAAPSRRPCVCADGQCSCCSGFVMQSLVNVAPRQRGCLDISYDPDDFAFGMVLKFNERVLYKNTISAKNPRPLCVSLPVATGAKLCVKLSNVYFVGRNLHACVDMEAKWNDAQAFQMTFDCIRVGANGVKVVKPEEGAGLAVGVPVGATPAPDEYDEIPAEHPASPEAGAGTRPPTRAPTKKPPIRATTAKPPTKATSKAPPAATSASTASASAAAAASPQPHRDAEAGPAATAAGAAPSGH